MVLRMGNKIRTFQQVRSIARDMRLQEVKSDSLKTGKNLADHTLFLTPFKKRSGQVIPHPLKQPFPFMANHVWDEICLLFFFLYKKRFIFIFDSVVSLLLSAGFLQLWQVGATLHCDVQASHCGRLLLLQSLSSRPHMSFSSCSPRTLELGLRRCSTQAQLPHGMWELPIAGIKPMPPALAGRFLTTGPAGKSLSNSC